ncbi:MmcQ/YjbR family DNA-binding protein [Leucobacter sp. 1207-22]|uniref:MmcQ/YjbR family DNA-binding protein n=1 Tax=Leucobacter sp. 1207-22 TaxID=2604456 RepID=UPI0040629739
MPDSQPIALDAVITAEWLTQAATQFVGAECYYKVEWEAEILAVGGKQFARLGTDNTGRHILTVKGDPLENEALCQEFTAVVPGYYSNKRHWISVILAETSFSEARIQELIAESYRLVFGSLTKKMQSELTNELPRVD